MRGYQAIIPALFLCGPDLPARPRFAHSNAACCLVAALPLRKGQSQLMDFFGLSGVVGSPARPALPAALDLYGIGQNSLLASAPWRYNLEPKDQGDETAQIEAELRWQFWKRFSLVGLVGGGAAWNDFNRFNNTQTGVAGSTRFRYVWHMSMLLSLVPMLISPARAPHP